MPVNRNKMIKAVGIGIACALAVIVVLTCVVSGIMMMLSSIPKNSLPYLMTAVIAIGALCGSYIAAAINGSKGLITGLFCGIGVFICLLMIGLCAGKTELGVMTFIRLGTASLCGVLGGIKGVNRKEKLHIR